MKDFENTSLIIFVLLTAVVVSSGCIESNPTDLKSDFNLDYNETSLNSSGMDVFRSSRSRAENLSDYSVNSSNSMAMNLPGVSVSVNMTSEGAFDQRTSSVNSSGVMGLNFAGNSNSTEFNTKIRSSENGTKIFSTGERNTSEQEVYSRKDLGITLEALNSIAVENASVLGVSNVDGQDTILFDLDVNSSDLLRNSERIFEVHSTVQESTDNGQGMEDAGSFHGTKAYLWVDREDRTPSRFAYYGSADNGTIQVRSVTEYR